MIFQIARSSYDCDRPPCPEAFERQCFYVDIRTVDDPAKIKFYQGVEWWYEYGVNHRVEKGKIVRDVPIELWFVEISSLDELLHLVQAHDDVIVRKYAIYKLDGSICQSIFIWDDP